VIVPVRVSSLFIILIFCFLPSFRLFLVVFSSPSAHPGITLAESRGVTVREVSAYKSLALEHIEKRRDRRVPLVRVSIFRCRRAPVPKLPRIRRLSRYLQHSSSSSYS
jgi:hypothetical protein